MLTISDNVAADALLDRIGIDAVNAGTARLGLVRARGLAARIAVIRYLRLQALGDGAGVPGRPLGVPGRAVDLDPPRRRGLPERRHDLVRDGEGGAAGGPDGSAITWGVYRALR